MISGTTMGSWGGVWDEQKYQREQRRIKKVNERPHKILTLLEGKDKKEFEKLLKEKEKKVKRHCLTGYTFSL